MHTDFQPRRHPARVAAQMAVVMLASLAIVVTSAATGLSAASAQTPPDTLGPVGLTLKPILQTSTTVVGQPIRFPQGDNQFVAVLAEVAPGGQVGRHFHPNPLFVYFLDGSLEIDMEGHGTHTFTAGDGFAEVVNTWHNGRNVGSVPARFLIVYAAQEGTPTLVRP